MRAADFELLPQDDGRIQPGIWTGFAQLDGHNYEIPVDLIVPEAVAPIGGRRGARLGVHGTAPSAGRSDWRPRWWTMGRSRSALWSPLTTGA